MAKKKQLSGSTSLLADRLDTLLRTVRCIAQHEDDLCTLLHDIRSSATLSTECAADLRTLLEAMPAEEYAWQIHAVEMDLNPSGLWNTAA